MKFDLSLLLKKMGSNLMYGKVGMYVFIYFSNSSSFFNNSIGSNYQTKPEFFLELKLNRKQNPVKVVP